MWCTPCNLNVRTYFSRYDKSISVKGTYSVFNKIDSKYWKKLSEKKKKIRKIKIENKKEKTKWNKIKFKDKEAFAQISIHWLKNPWNSQKVPVPVFFRNYLYLHEHNLCNLFTLFINNNYHLIMWVKQLWALSKHCIISRNEREWKGRERTVEYCALLTPLCPKCSVRQISGRSICLPLR